MAKVLYLEQDNLLYRPSEVFLLQGDASKAKQKLGWENKTKFESLVKEMVDNDLKLFSNSK
ncbi:GDP-mannose 4,6-dehydratase [bacterium]|nr:GDP-mannose 4,6-dehydratase [bacterium]